MTSSAGGVVADRGQDVAHRGRRGEPHRRRAEAEPDRAQPHLLGRFLARDIDDVRCPRSPAAPRPGAAGSTCRCRDRRRPASPIPATMPPPIARSNSAMPLGSRSGSAAGVSSPTSGISRPPPCRLCLAAKMLDTSAGFLDQRVPLGAIGALPLPAVRHRPAGLAHVSGFGLGHRSHGLARCGEAAQRGAALAR